MKTLTGPAVLLAFFWTATPLLAQDLRYRTETDVEFGGALGVEPEPEPAELEQSVLFRVRTQVTEVERGSFPGALFEVPEGYTERPLPQIGG